MGKSDRTAWTEGMFLGPQHFQQHDRFLLATIAGVARGGGRFAYGLLHYEIDDAALAEGTFAIRTIGGIFPDGTPFHLPDEAELPDPLPIGVEVRDRVVSLALPFASQAEKDIAETKSRESFSCYLLAERTVSDRHSPDSDAEEALFTAGLWTRLVLDDAAAGAFHTVPLARVSERREDGSVALDPAFHCCAMALAASQPLLRACRELHALLVQRAAELASRLGTVTASDSAQLEQLLLLRTINRTAPLIAHIGGTAVIHPESLYAELVQIAGELSTVTRPDRQCPAFPDYLHRDQNASFAPVFASLRESLDWIPEATVESFPVEHVRGGTYKTTVPDRHLFESARFVLAVKAREPPDRLARRLPGNTTIASRTKLRELVRSQAPGIEITALVNVPNRIPTYENHVYFGMNQDGPLWREIALSGDIALHVAGDFSDLQMQIWTVAR